jgi:hypothetical protein
LRKIRALVGVENLEWMAKDILEGGTYIDRQCNWIAIRFDTIDDVMEGDFANEDAYSLGCYNPIILHETTGWPLALLNLARDADRMSDVGEALTTEHKKELAQKVRDLDGYGIHFARYDGIEHIIRLNDTVGSFYFFKVD